MGEDQVVLAELKRARGLRGEIFANPLGAKVERFIPGLRAFLHPAEAGGEARPAVLERSWVFLNRLVLKFDGIDTKSEAEKIEGWQMRIPAAERPVLSAGEFYLSDLEGCRVETPDGRLLGEVTGWLDTGPQVLLEVGSMLIPFVRELCLKIEPEARKIVVDLPEGLEDLNRG